MDLRSEIRSELLYVTSPKESAPLTPIPSQMMVASLIPQSSQGARVSEKPANHYYASAAVKEVHEKILARKQQELINATSYMLTAAAHSSIPRPISSPPQQYAMSPQQQGGGFGYSQGQATSVAEGFNSRRLTLPPLEFDNMHLSPRPRPPFSQSYAMPPQQQYVRVSSSPQELVTPAAEGHSSSRPSSATSEGFVSPIPRPHHSPRVDSVSLDTWPHDVELQFQPTQNTRFPQDISDTKSVIFSAIRENFQNPPSSLTPEPPARRLSPRTPDRGHGLGQDFGSA